MDDGDINSFIDTFGALMRLLPWNTKVHRKVPSWDYCEILVRTVSNKFIKNGWPRQSFLGTMRTEEVFVRSVSFYAESNKGQKFLNAVLNDIRQGRIKPFGFQWKILNSQP